MEHKYIVKNSYLILKQIETNDLEVLRKYRNNKKNSKYLRNIPFITSKMQKKWYQDYLKDDSSIGFSIFENLKNKKLIGSLFLYNIDRKKKTAEIGRILIGDKSVHGKHYGYISLNMLTKFAFDKEKLCSINAVVNIKNISSLVSFIKNGYIINLKEKIGKDEWQYVLYINKKEKKICK